MFKYVIEGGHPLKGVLRVGGNKNAALPCIAATLLTDEAVLLKNIPEIADVKVLFQIIESMGGSVSQQGQGEFLVKPALKTHEVPADLATKLRASILLIGPILARLGKVVLPPPGGDVIGRRRLDTHFLAFETLGARIEVDGVFNVFANKLVGTDMFLDEASVTATENAIMAAALSEGKSIISNAASEPHVQDLCHMINAMGGDITGIGSNVLHIKGVKKLHGCEFKIGTDFMEVGSFIGLAASCKSELEIQGVDHSHLHMCKIAFGKLGITWESSGDSLLVRANQSMKIQSDWGNAIPTIDDAPWPGFPADLTSIMVVTATQCDGTIIIHEKMYESRLFFTDKLNSMGARIILCDPHRAVISGPCRLNGAELSSPDVRAGMAMVIAALAASGESIISNIYQIERGYENIVDRLTAIGARIKKIEA
ncbi:MAG: UDP-N-acetylglucosamine 1-carboxyvinyltransferase [Spirochaetia bacterium]